AELRNGSFGKADAPVATLDVATTTTEAQCLDDAEEVLGGYLLCITLREVDQSITKVISDHALRRPKTVLSCEACPILAVAGLPGATRSYPGPNGPSWRCADGRRGVSSTVTAS